MPKGAYKRTAESKAKESIIQTRVHNKPEVRARHSAAAKLLWANPEVRAKRIASLKRVQKEAHNRPEVKAKISAATKRALADPVVRAKLSLSAAKSMSKRTNNFRPSKQATHILDEMEKVLGPIDREFVLYNTDLGMGARVFDGRINKCLTSFTSPFGLLLAPIST